MSCNPSAQAAKPDSNPDNEDEIECIPYVFHDTPELLPEGTNGTMGTSKRYVYFGDFPQDVLSYEMEAKLTFDEENAITRGYLTYIPANDGNYYVYMLENAQKNALNTPTYVDGTEVKKQTENSYRYFKVMPLKWVVLTDNYDVDGTSGNKTGSLLFCENVITGGVKYNPSPDNTNFHDYTTENGVHSFSDFNDSQIRGYLNGIATYYSQYSVDYTSNGFLQTAFSQEAINKIITTCVDNSKEQQCYPNIEIDYSNTNDKIFLLSTKELTNSDYGFGDMAQKNVRKRFATDYAKAAYSDIYMYSGYGTFYFTRSRFTYVKNLEASGHPEKNYYYGVVDIVMFDGSILNGWYKGGDYNSYTCPDFFGSVLPALCVNLE